MIFYASCVANDGEKFREIAAPSLESLIQPGDIVRTAPGSPRGIAAVYNDFIREARSIPDCQALVLMHDDVQIVDPNFRSKVLRALDPEQVGILGVVGGSDLTSAEWWEARRKVGHVYETRGAIEFAEQRGAVDVVDGLLLVLSPRAFAVLEFDEKRFPAFHGYDVDICLQAKTTGLEVVVESIEVLHRTKGGYGDTTAFSHSASELQAKWSKVIRPLSIVERTQRLPATARTALARRTRGLRSKVRAARRGDVLAQTSSTQSDTAAEIASPPDTCAACGCPGLPLPETDPTAEILTCSTCGAGTTWPAPARDALGDQIWVEMYGASRLARRSVWEAEARTRVKWIQMYQPEGCLLEIGSATGEFVKAAQDEGYTASGVEPSSWAAQEASALGVPIHAGFLAGWVATNPHIQLDVAAMWHVLEHVASPADLLLEVHAILRPGGYMFIEVPNYDSSEARRLGGEWASAHLADHYVHFTPEGIERLLGRCGFDVVHVRPMTPRVYESLQSFRRRKNIALLGGHEWPSLDLLRVVGRRPLDSEAHRGTELGQL